MRHRETITRLSVCLVLLGSAAAAFAAKPIETFSASAVSLGTGATGTITFTINRWSTDEERDKLLTTLQEFGTDKLLDALQKIRPPVGYMRRANSTGWDLYYARNNAMPDGSRRVVLATNRKVAFAEASNNTRSMQYQFTLIEIHIDKDGKGEGKLVPAGRVSWDKDKKEIVVENYGNLPVDLINVIAKTP
jgi:hypothetical protein